MTTPTRLLLIADTHVPDAPATCRTRCGRRSTQADVVVHAGDWVDVALLDALESAVEPARRRAAATTTARELRERLPEVARSTLDGLRFAVVHETGAAKGREERMRGRASRHRRARLRAQPHPVGHHDRHRAAAAQPRLADRPPAPAALHLHDRVGGRRRAASTSRLHRRE